MKIFGIDPGSDRTGYGCVERIGSRHTLVICGSLSGRANAPFPDKLQVIHAGLIALLREHRPECVAVENIFYARNVRSALKLGHARGVALLAAAEAGIPVVEYAPAEIKRAVVGYGRAEKHQVQQMIRLLLGLEKAPSPHDVADALAVAICHLNAMAGPLGERLRSEPRVPGPRSWREYRPTFAKATVGKPALAKATVGKPALAKATVGKPPRA